MPGRLLEKVALERIRNKVPEWIDTSEVAYRGMKTPVKLICKFHGEHFYTPDAIRAGCYCSECSGIKKAQSQKSNTNEFKKKVRDKWGDLYIVTGEYVDAKTLISFYCNKHKTEFTKTPNNFLKGERCELCQYEAIYRNGKNVGKIKLLKKKQYRRQTHSKLTKEEIADRINKIFHGKYDLSKFLDDKVEYKNNKQIIEVGCPVHCNFFKKSVNNLLLGQGCPECSNKRQNRYVNSTETFIKKAESIWGNLYDYSETKYVKNSNKVWIKCNKCGNKFKISPNNHTNKTHPQGCPFCNHPHQAKTTEEFINEMNAKFPNKFNMVKVKYVTREIPITMICNECGKEIIRSPKYFLEGHGCPECSRKSMISKQRKPFSKFKKEIDKLYNNNYVIDESTYVNANTTVKVACKIHNNIFWKTPHKLLQGDGCPICHESKLEREIRNVLNENKINFVPQCNDKIFPWLSTGKYSTLSFDFYLPDYKIAIECQGKQHYESSDFFGGVANFIIQQKRDRLKKELSEENDIKIFYFTHYQKIEEKGDIYKDKEHLLKRILNESKPESL